MFVKKRNGTSEECSFDKVLQRVQQLSYGLDVNAHLVAQSVCSRIFSGVATWQLDELAAVTCSSLILQNPDYSHLAARIVISNHHKETLKCFSQTVKVLYDKEMISQKHYDCVSAHAAQLDEAIDYTRDYLFDFFGFTTLFKGYLMKMDGKVIERPQDMYMRVAVGIHGHDVSAAIETYHLMSLRFYTHATPTLFQAGTNRPQLSSCFLTAIESDSIGGIYNTVGECALISKYAGGIGMHISNVRARNSLVRGTNGISSGIVPMLRVFNATARYANQCGRRPGSIAVFLEPWHADVMEFLDLRKNHGSEEERARDLFIAMWVPDIFMLRVKGDETWSLMCPDACPGLQDVYGTEFERLYLSYEAGGKFVKQVPAKQIWMKILESQIETGLPYIGFKDNVNRKSNQQNIGIIKGSNLCMEINQVSSKDETACCNLASICLPTYVTDRIFDFSELHRVTKIVVRNLNKIIDVNFYPVEKARISNLQHRPIGIGVQGLADVFAMLDIAFESSEAKLLNTQIFETMYHAALQSSMELAMVLGPYASFPGSPASMGILQFDMWNHTPPTDRYDWIQLKKNIRDHGTRNSLLIAPMPTASTSQICGFNECFEPFTSCIYKRRTSAGEYLMVNKYLVAKLSSHGLWNDVIKRAIIVADGSVQSIEAIPPHVRALFKTVWEIKQKVLIDMAADRGPYVCQSQSMNLFLQSPTFQTLSNMLFYSWSVGNKCGIYYLRSQSKSKTQQFTIEPSVVEPRTQCGEIVCDMCSA